MVGSVNGRGKAVKGGGGELCTGRGKLMIVMMKGGEEEAV